MKFLDKIYTITIIDQGKLCWDVSVRDKTLEDYKKSERFLGLCCLFVIFCCIGSGISN